MPGEATIGKLAVELGLDAKEFARLMQFIEGVTEGAKEELEAYKRTLGSTEKQVKTGEQALRGFYREQRLQDRTMREVTQAVSSLAFGVAFLTQGNEKAGPVAKKLGDSMLTFATTLNTAELAGFGMARAGEAIGGTLGKVATGFSRILGPIGLVVATGAALISFFQKSNAEANKAASEGLAKYNAELEKAAENQDALTPKVEQARGEALQATIARLTDQEKVLRGLLDRMKDAYERGVDLVVTDAEARVLSFNGVMQVSTEAVRELLYGTEAVYKDADEEFKKTHQNIVGILPQINKASRELLMLGTTAEGERPKAVTKEQARALEKERIEAHKAAQERILALTVEGIENEREARAKQIEADYTKAENTANEAFKKHKDRELLKQELAAADAVRRKAYADDALALEEQRAAAVQEARLAEIDTVKNEQDRLTQIANATYEYEVALIERKYEKDRDEQLRTAALRKALADKEKALQEVAVKAFATAGEIQTAKLQAMSTIVDGLNQAFGKNQDTAFAKIMAIAQLAIRIAMQMQALNAMAAQGMSIGALGPIGIIAMALGGISTIFGRQSGGYTGPGMASQPVGAVHAGEYVFEKRLADRFLPELTAMRASMQRGRAPEGGGMLMPARIEIVGRVDIDNGALFARKEYLGADKFNKKKLI